MKLTQCVKCEKALNDNYTDCAIRDKKTDIYLCHECNGKVCKKEKDLTIITIQKIRKELNLTHIIIFGRNENNVISVHTAGGTEKQKLEAAEAGNKLKKVLQFPSHMCSEVPNDNDKEEHF